MNYQVRAIDLRRRMILMKENAPIVTISRGDAYTYAELPSGRSVRFPHQSMVWVKGSLSDPRDKVKP